jgi:galactokinase
MNTTSTPDTALLARTLKQFQNAFGTQPEHLVQAPGRVNIIGEHTDYNGGFVLPCAIDYQTLVAATRRADRTVRVVAADYGGAVNSFSLDGELQRSPEAPWADYVRGMVWALREAGVALCGANLVVAGNVPQGAGLSSSASLEVAVGQAFKTLQGLAEPDATQLALLAQRAENAFVGINCGIMDQLISARGMAGHALLIDCRNLQAQAVHMPDDLVVLIVDSRVQRGLVSSEYNLRRQQCEAAAAHYGVKFLRELSLERLNAEAAGLDEVAFRRARHIVSDSLRAEEAALALSNNDLRHMGRLMRASHASMRDDFQITVPAIDQLADILNTAIGDNGGARMTGGGFGGCVVALLPQAALPAALAAVNANYRSPTGDAGVCHVCHASAGAGPLN